MKIIPLSDKRKNCKCSIESCMDKLYLHKDVKEAVEKLKEEIRFWYLGSELLEKYKEIDKIFGDFGEEARG